MTTTIPDRPILSLKNRIPKPIEPVLSKEEQEQKNKLELRDKAMKLLIQTYPNCFFDYNNPEEKKKIRPLKKGILKDIFKDGKIEALGISKRVIRDVVYYYCHNTRYLNRLIKSKFRITLKGKKRGMVVIENKKYTTNIRLKEILKKNKIKNLY